MYWREFPVMAKLQCLGDSLKSLSTVQAEAVRHRDGALLVLAGPGSGKTRVLTTRIARLLHETPDEHFRVLALTFTNRAADEMRERIERLSPAAENRLFVGTFHAFCADILRQHGQHLNIRTNFRIYSTNEDRARVARLAISSASGQEDGLNEQDARHARYLRLVTRAKARLLPVEGISKKFPNAAAGREFESFYAAYDRALREVNALDFDSLIHSAHQLFSRYPALAKRYRSVFRYWCIDEFQDTNFGQYNLLKAMAGQDFRNVFAVADDDQIIYQWNGADYRRLDQFRTDFDASMLQIPDNFRCPPEVVTCANRLIRRNHLRTANKQPLVAGGARPAATSVIKVLRFRTQDEEARGIANHIAVNRVGELEQTAVLARIRRLLGPIEAELSALGINARIVVRRDEFQSSAFRWLHSALRLAVYDADERTFTAFAGTFNEMFGGTFTPDELVAQSGAGRVELLSRWYSFVQEQIKIPDALRLAKAVVEHRCGAENLDQFTGKAIDVFESWLAEDVSDLAGPQSDTYPGALPGSEKRNPAKRNEPANSQASSFSNLKCDLDAWCALSSDVRRVTGASPEAKHFLQELDLRSKQRPVKPNTVLLTTIHGAKGNEFEHVYLVGLAEDVLPSWQSAKKGGDSPEFEEERRNCFVAITRCEESLTLSFASRYWGWDKNPSRFLAEMGLQQVPTGKTGGRRPF